MKMMFLKSFIFLLAYLACFFTFGIFAETDFSQLRMNQNIFERLLEARIDSKVEKNPLPVTDEFQ